MLKLLLAAAIAVPAMAATASAQPYAYGNPYHERNADVRREVRECNRELRHARNRWEYQREMRECQREIAQARRDSRHWNDRDRRYDNRSGYNRYDRYNRW